MGRDSEDRRVAEVRRLQAENDRILLLPDEVALKLAEASALCPSRVDAVLGMIRAGRTSEEIAEAEGKRLDAMAADWSLDRESVGWLSCSPFMAEFTRWIRKRATDKSWGGLKVGTAAAIYNPRTEEVEIAFNPRFMTSIYDGSMKSNANGPDPHGAGVSEHEHFHLMLNHVTSRRREPAALWNLATDCAINSLIARCDTSARLPPMLILPGLRAKGPVSKDCPEEVRAARDKLADIIAKLPQEKSSEWYFEEIKRKSEKEGYQWGQKGMKVPGAGDGEWILYPSDEHGAWDDVPEEIRDLVEGKVRHALRQACNKGDSSPNGWGNVPQELREELRAIAFGSVDWRRVLKNWVGSRQAGGRSRSIKRVDRRFPYVHPGLKKGRNPHIAIMVDQSGSVDDGQLARIFGALEACSKQTTFDVIPFDHSVAEDKRFTWRRGTKPRLERVRCGGTSFDAAVEYVNHPKLRGLYDGVIIATDGECSRPAASRVKLAWLITPGHKLTFDVYPGEMVIQMNEKDDLGAGRW